MPLLCEADVVWPSLHEVVADFVVAIGLFELNKVRARDVISGERLVIVEARFSLILRVNLR